MKRTFLLAVAAAVFFLGCNKHVENTPPASPPSPVNYLIASAGNDTIICMPFGGLGNIFKGILDGRASRDDSGKIVSYSWSEIIGSPPNTYLNSVGYGYTDSTIYSRDSAVVTFLLNSRGVHQFMLKVRDDQGRVASSTVRINLIQNFDPEYEGLSWDSTAGVLTTISIKNKPGLIENWPDFAGFVTDLASVSLGKSNGGCFDTTQQEVLPYVPYDSIQLTDELLFYSLISVPPTATDNGHLYPEIFAKTNSGIDFNQKVSVGFIEAFPDYWDYKISPMKLTRKIRAN